MSRKVDPADVVVKFFSEASPDTALTVFQISKGIVDRRGLLAGKKKPKTKTTRGAGAAADAHAGAPQ